MTSEAIHRDAAGLQHLSVEHIEACAVCTAAIRKAALPVVQAIQREQAPAAKKPAKGRKA